MEQRGARLAWLWVALVTTSACTCGQATHAPRLDAVVPPFGFVTDDTPIRLDGEAFEPQVRLRWGAAAGDTSSGAAFRVLLGGVELTDVAWADAQTLTATVPRGMALGLHPVRVVGPLGVETTLEAAYEVRERQGASLTAQLSTASSRVLVGTSIAAWVDVQNTGDTAADSVFIEAGAPTGTAPVTLVPMAITRLALAPGQSTRFNLLWVTRDVGTVTLSASARGNDAFSGGPVAAGPVSAPPVDVVPPALLSATLTSDQQRYLVGEPIALQLLVVNQGATPVTGLAPVATATPAVRVTATSVPTPRDLAPGQTQAFPFSWDAVARGPVTFVVAALGTEGDGGIIGIPNVTLAVAIDPVDAGVEDCANRLDDDGNGLADCADPACGAGAACDDGDPCTTGDACGGGTCAGQPRCGGPVALCFISTGCDAGVCAASPAPARTFCDGGQCDGAGRCAPFCDATDPALRACFQFENDLTDGSQYGNQGTRLDGAFVSGARGAAYHPGTAAITSTNGASLDCTTELTLEAWMRLDSFPAPGQRYGVIDNNNQYGLFIGPAGELSCTVGSAVAGGVVPLGGWHQVACTLDAVGVRLFIDGVSIASLAVPGLVLTPGDTSGLHLAENSPGGDVLQGAIDGVRVWCARRTPLDLCTTPGECG